MSVINRIVAEVKYSMIYKCSACGKEAVGDTARDVMFVGSSEELKDSIDRLPQTSHHMPVGWSFNGKFTCGCDK